ncbi:6-pyruvoyltetrahydropterin/6-carboxytetrahydropterin synthase [Gammaproteobacteria bacterium]
MGTYSIATASFESARTLEERLHGHGFLVRAIGTQDSLQDKLLTCAAQLDYTHLNEILTFPTDLNLARWFLDSLEIPVVSIGVQSTGKQGAYLKLGGSSYYWCRYRFEAAHWLPNVELGHPCGRMHGHGFEVTLHSKQTEQSFLLLEKAWHPLYSLLEGICLNNLPGLENPTSELLANWIWQHLILEFPSLSKVTVRETETAGCHYDGKKYQIWKTFRFESALYSPKLKKLFGHGYLLKLYLSVPLDTVMGWTVDYGEVKRFFDPIRIQLDHHVLNDLPNLFGIDAISVASWIGQKIQLPGLDRIDLYETPEHGAILTFGDTFPEAIAKML